MRVVPLIELEEIDPAVSAPLTPKLVSVPTEVMFGCAAVVAEMTPTSELAVIEPEIAKFDGMLNVPTDSDPATVNDESVPTEVMFGWAAVCNVPVSEDALSPVIPDTLPSEFRTNALLAAAVPATTFV